MSINIEIQRVCSLKSIPSDEKFQLWSEAVLKERITATELNIRIVEEHEIAELNKRYRGKNKSTNVLSFPFDAVTPDPMPILGDLVICAPLVAREAQEQSKEIESHWAHLVVHGILHLLGYDHETVDDMKIMETLESEILTKMNYPAPYEIQTI